MRPLALAVLAALAAPALAQPETGARMGLSPVLADTVLASEVESVDGREVLVATGEPVTAVVVDAYPSGAKRMQRGVVDGLAEGLWMEWYESGVPRFLAMWHRGRGEGVWTYFHETGVPRERATVAGDVYDGPVEGWHANGRKSFEGTNRANARVGTWRFWTEDGALDREETYPEPPAPEGGH